MAKKLDRKQCFVIGPIGDDDSDDRIHADWLLEDIILPVFAEHFEDFNVTRADKISKSGQINTQVITALLEADLVIADLTTLNPNAFYEIGIRHTIQKPIIHVHLEGQRIPFDIAPFRSIKFSRKRPSDIRAARVSLLEFVKEALDPEHKIDNPVTFSRGRVEFEQSATKQERVMLDEIASLRSRLRSMEDTVQSHSAVGFASFAKRGARFKLPSLLMEVSAPSHDILEDFLRERLDFGFKGITLVEDNEINQVIQVPDTPENRTAIENLGVDARKFKGVKIEVTIR